jgi:hypothetical protein
VQTVKKRRETCGENASPARQFVADGLAGPVVWRRIGCYWLLLSGGKTVFFTFTLRPAVAPIAAYEHGYLLLKIRS